MSPLYDYLCPKCEHKFESFAGINEETQTCRWPECDGVAERIFVSVSGIGERYAQPFTPVVYHQAPDGAVSFPGRSDELPPPGYEKVELKTVREIRKFEAEMNRREYAVWQEHQENVDRARQDNVKRRREDIQALMRGEGRQVTTIDEHGNERTVTLNGFSRFGRNLARIAIDHANNKPREKFDPNFHVQVFSQDSSNRRPWRDVDTGWKGRKA
jgi:putative FmdB family regulatory protein